ncbi:MAG: ABC transporter permease [Firmicutes bacterium]|nr:ABC transporter permease [Bacillota bacterium]
MDDIITINLWQFAIVYAVLIVILIIMKKCNVKKTKLLFIASLRMTVQLVLAGLVLTFILDNQHWGFTVGYLILMTGFAIGMVLWRNKTLNLKFKFIIASSLAVTGLAMVTFFVIAIVGADFFDARYTIPLAGMIIGNAMTGLTLGLRSFREQLKSNKAQIEALINIGATPKKILIPFVNRGIETAILPSLQSMLGMGIISLPGMMTGQILSGTSPQTAILYQIAILITISGVVALSVFLSLFLGYRTLYNKRCQIAS